ncbi:MAG TPA: TetR/AcrR family transcriptional regulator [Pseudonocardia sp.]|jgi:AcrR family transcriptional regulator
MVVSSRERILDVAMELFGQHGFKGTSIVRIETAAGLAPGSGGIYHYFRNKEALLQAGIERHLNRLDALRDIQRILVGIGDLRAELTVLGRYALAELDREADLLRIVLAEARTRPELLDAAADQLVRATYSGFAGWLGERAGLSSERANAVATVGLGALFSARLLRLLLGRDPLPVSDDDFIATWVQMVHTQISSGSPT